MTTLTFISDLCARCTTAMRSLQFTTGSVGEKEEYTYIKLYHASECKSYLLKIALEVTSVSFTIPGCKLQETKKTTEATVDCK